MMKKILALLLVVVTVAGFMVPVHAAEDSGRMSLEVIGPAHMDLDDEIMDKVVAAVKGKITADKAADLLGGLKKLF